MAKKKVAKSAQQVKSRLAKNAKPGAAKTPGKRAGTVSPKQKGTTPGVTLNTKFRKGEAGASGEQRLISLAQGRKQVTVEDAVRQRAWLYPLATDQEIAAMLDLDGAGISPEEVARIRASRSAKTASSAPRTPLKKRTRR